MAWSGRDPRKTKIKKLVKIGDLVAAPFGADYDDERLGIIISVLVWHGIREIKVRFMDGTIQCYSPFLIKKINYKSEN